NVMTESSARSWRDRQREYSPKELDVHRPIIRKMYASSSVRHNDSFAPEALVALSNSRLISSHVNTSSILIFSHSPVPNGSSCCPRCMKRIQRIKLGKSRSICSG